MKKLLLIIGILISSSAFAIQVDLYNYTVYNLNYQINTVNKTSHSYPKLWSTNTLLILTPALQHVEYLQGTGLYPFATLTTPYPNPPVISWVRQTASGASQIATSNSVAQSVFGNSQVFGFLKFSFSGIPFSANLGPWGDNPGTNSYTYNNGQVTLEYILDDATGDIIYLAT